MKNALAISYFAVSAVFAGYYIHTSLHTLQIELLSGDAVGGALKRWVSGDTTWNLWHHNSAQSLVQMLAMLADIYLGPYPYWSCGFVYVTWIVFFSTTLWVMGTRYAAYVVSSSILLWFSYNNTASTFSYSWVHVEVAAQLTCISAVLFAIRLWQCSPNKPSAHISVILGLIVLFFSHAHKGFYFPLIFFFLGLTIDKWRHRWFYAGAGLAYLVYIFVLDGFMMSFISRMRGDEGGGSVLIEKLYGAALLGTGVFYSVAHSAGIVLQQNQWEGWGSLGFITLFNSARVVLFVAFVGIGFDCLRRIVWRREKSYGIPLVFIAPSLGMIVTTALGRYGQLGVDIQFGERYWYNSILLLIGVAAYLDTSKPRFAIRKIFVAIFATSAIVVLLGTLKYWPHQLAYTYHQTSIQLARAFDPSVRFGYQWYEADVLIGFGRIRKLLEEQNAEVFSFWGLKVLAYLESPRVPIETCRDITVIKQDVAFLDDQGQMLQFWLQDRVDIDLIVAFDDNRKLGLSYPLKFGARNEARLHAKKISDEARVVFYHRSGDTQLRAVCELRLLPESQGKRS